MVNLCIVFLFICVKSSLFSNDYWRVIFIKHAYSIIPVQYEETPLSMYITRLIPCDPALSIRSRECHHTNNQDHRLSHRWNSYVPSQCNIWLATSMFAWASHLEMFVAQIYWVHFLYIFYPKRRGIILRNMWRNRDFPYKSQVLKGTQLYLVKMI